MGLQNVVECTLEVAENGNNQLKYKYPKNELKSNTWVNVLGKILQWSVWFCHLASVFEIKVMSCYFGHGIK